MTTARRHNGAPEEERKTVGAPANPRVPTDVPAGDHPRASTEGEQGAAEVEHDLDELLADVKRERDEYLELARRARADFENFRKRASRDSEEAERRGKAGLARQLVPALDNLERALRSAGIDPDRRAAAPAEPESREVSAHEALAEGVALVFSELRETLARAGVESYDPTGERFDPTWHEALATRPAPGSDAGVVLETVEKGYRLDGQLIRAARVVVSG